MIIDSHTHVFPDKIAEKSILSLQKSGNQKAEIGGTVNDLLNAMRNNGVDKSVVLPVLTKPESFDSINRFAAEINKIPEIISFAGIHPYCENINKLLDRIKQMGFKGIKLHPDFQETDITDEGYVKIIHGAGKRGLKVVIHAGIDPSYPNHIHCPPELSAEVIKELTPKNTEPFIVLAHLGGITENYEKTARLLVGLPFFFDTSFVLEKTEQTILKEIINEHGYNRVLFATDSPWRNAKQYIKIIRALNLSIEETNAILGYNVAKLLDI